MAATTPMTMPVICNTLNGPVDARVVGRYGEELDSGTVDSLLSGVFSGVTCGVGEDVTGSAAYSAMQNYISISTEQAVGHN